MSELHVYADVENDFDLDPDKMVAQGELTSIGLLREGTVGGKATVSMVITLRDGNQVFAETTWRLFSVAATALAATEIARSE